MVRMLLVCCFPILVSAQKQPSAPKRNEFSFTSDNDAYLLQYHDAYYSNGIMLAYTRANSHKQHKRLLGFELGQKIYTPVNRFSSPISAIDRPYCGYLYLKYQQTDFLPKDALLQWSASIGVFGDNSGAEALQNQFHALFRYKRFSGWAYQIQDAITVNFGAQYAQTLWQPTYNFKIVPIAKGSLGTGFINAGAGAYFCFGLFEQNQQSELWHARVSKEATSLKRSFEYFLFALPEWYYQNYNATLQGDKLTSNTSAVLAQPIDIVFQQTIGLCLAEKRVSGKIAWVYQSRETYSQVGTQQYLSLQFNYRF
jgi:hypothetical protein